MAAATVVSNNDISMDESAPLDIEAEMKALRADLNISTPKPSMDAVTPTTPAPAPVTPAAAAAAERKAGADGLPHWVHEPDWVSEEEKAKVAELRTKYADIMKGHNDKVIMCYLIAVKGNVERCAERMASYTKLRVDFGLTPAGPLKYSALHPSFLAPLPHPPPPTFCPELLPRLPSEPPSIGMWRPWMYMCPRNFRWSEYTGKDMVRYIITMNERNMRVFPLASFRAGFIMMHDLSGTSRATMPAVSDSKIFMQAVSNSLPIRVHSINVLNPNIIFRFMLRIARLFLKTKILSRLSPCTEAELKDRLAQSLAAPGQSSTATTTLADGVLRRLLPHVGGRRQWDVHHFIQTSVAAEKLAPADGAPTPTPSTVTAAAAVAAPLPLPSLSTPPPMPLPSLPTVATSPTNTQPALPTGPRFIE